MVPRRLARATALALTLLAAALLLPALADASNRRISISNYQWSSPEIDIDLNEHVTWFWTGPDTMHSITGDSPNAKQWDSDPGTLPQHRIGDDYQVSFTQPGVYSFQCKIHSLVRGDVTVSNTPGDPESEPDPIPKSNVDLVKPEMRAITLAPKFGRNGSSMKYSIAERGNLDVEYYRYSSKDQKQFAGYAKYKSYVGYNRARIGVRKPHFKPKAGRYLIKMRVTDESNNTSKVKKRRFRVF